MSREILISDEVYSDVERMCARLNMTPEEFINDATEQMIMKNLSGEEITARINAACAEMDTTPDPILSALQEQILEKEEW